MFLRRLKDLVCPITDVNTTRLFYLVTCLRDVTGNIDSQFTIISSAAQLGWLWNQGGWSSNSVSSAHLLCDSGQVPYLPWSGSPCWEMEVRGEAASEDCWED